MKKSSMLRDGREELIRKEKRIVPSEKLAADNKESEKEKQKQGGKQFSRRSISKEDLISEEAEQEPSRQEFTSSWAKEMEEELSRAAAKVDMRRDRRMEGQKTSSERMENGEKEKEPQNRLWEKLLNRKKMTKVRKPLIIKNWFADEPESSDVSSDSMDDTTEVWSEVEQKRRNRQKTKQRKLKKERKIEELSKKMKHIVGIGPIVQASIEHFEEETNDKAEARRLAANEYLKYYLLFNDNEIN